MGFEKALGTAKEWGCELEDFLEACVTGFDHVKLQMSQVQGHPKEWLERVRSLQKTLDRALLGSRLFYKSF